MPFRLRMTAAAQRDLGRLRPEVSRRILQSLDALREDPRRARPGADVKRLQGHPGQHRLRVGEHRVFYVVDDGTVWITGVRHRSNAYD